MLKHIEQFLERLAGQETSLEITDEEERIACAVLLLHCARTDGVQTEEETDKIQHLLMGAFSLTPANVATVMMTAQQHERDALDLYPFTSVLQKSWGREQRLEFVRMMWEVVYADEEIDFTERSTVSFIAELLHVETKEVVRLRRDVTSS